MELNTVVIQKALAIGTDIDHVALAKLAGFNEKELVMVTMFWDAAFNKSWIYLSTEVIHNQFGYTKTNVSLSDFHKKIKKLTEKILTIRKLIRIMI